MSVDLKWYASLPRKRVGTGALLRNGAGQILIVKPGYKAHWSLPGGVVDADESPRLACQREIHEEIGLDPASLRLLCVAWTLDPERGESLQFLFDGGILSPSEIQAMRLHPDELTDAAFMDSDAALALLSEPLASRVRYGIMLRGEDSVAYLEQRRLGEWITERWV